MAAQMTAMRNRPAKEDTEIHQQSSANLFPNTVLQTSDINAVVEHVEKITT